MDIKQIITEVAAGNTALGGGAVAPLSGAIGSALGQRALVKISKKVQAENGQLIDQLHGDLQTYRQQFLDFVEIDKNVTERLMAVFALPKGSDEEKAARHVKLQKALIEATEIPLQIMATAVQAMEVFSELAPFSTKGTAADIEIGIIHLETALMAANINVQENIALIDDAELVNQYDDQAAAFIEQAENAYGEVES